MICVRIYLRNLREIKKQLKQLQQLLFCFSFIEDNTDNEDNNSMLTISLDLSTSMNCPYCSYCLLNKNNLCKSVIICVLKHLLNLREKCTRNTQNTQNHIIFLNLCKSV